jgi:hypothetical protein
MKLLQWVKEIKSKSGILHFKRFAIIETTYFSIYIHKIYEADKDKHMHSHPWAFFGLVLNGSYIESYLKDKDSVDYRIKSPFGVGFGGREYFHKIELITDGPVTTLFLTFGKHLPWYYSVEELKIESTEYRKLKNEGQFV